MKRKNATVVVLYLSHMVSVDVKHHDKNVVVIVLYLNQTVSVDAKHHEKKECRGRGPVTKPCGFCGRKAP